MSEPRTPEPVEPPGFVPPIILRNKGVPITLYRLENDALPDLDDDEGERPTRKAFLRFNANHVADIEEAFDGIVARVPVVRTQYKILDGKNVIGEDGKPETEDVIDGYEDRVFYGVDAFQQSLSQRKVATIRRVFAIALGMDAEAMGLAMIPNQAPEYETAVGVAWSICQGVDPSDAARLLKEGLAAAAEGRARMASEFEKMTGAAEASSDVTPGETGPPPGSPSADPSPDPTASGSTPPDR